VAPDQVQLEHAPPDDKRYANPFFGEQMTRASSSVRAFDEPLRRAGATARTMLVAAAAASWNVDPASCRAQKGVVTHTPTGRILTYGVLAAKAAALPVPDKITLKDPKDFTLIGTPAKRLDTPSKVNGTAQFGIDVRLPGMLIATVAASPVLGGKVAGVHVRKDGCEVWSGSQVLSRVQAAASAVTGFPLEKVVVHNHLLGGGFGRRLEVDYVTQAVRIAKQVDAPVKVVWTREEDVQHDVYRPYYYDRIAAGLDPRGTPVVWTHRIVGPAIVARFLPPAFKAGIDINAWDGPVHLLYDIRGIRLRQLPKRRPGLNTAFGGGWGFPNNTS